VQTETVKKSKFVRRGRKKPSKVVVARSSETESDDYDEFLKEAKGVESSLVVCGSPEDALVSVNGYIEMPGKFQELITAPGFPCGLISHVYGEPDCGKCLRPDTKILMYDGSIKLAEDILIDDVLMGPDSGPRVVKSVCSGEENMYEVSPNYGEPWGCNESHVLTLRCSSSNRKDFEKGGLYDISIKEYLDLNKSFRVKLKQVRTGVEFKGEDLPYDPYWVGLWLGDGTKGEPHITSPDVELEPYFEDFSDDANLIYRSVEYGDRCRRHTFTTEIGQPNPLRVFVGTFISDDGQKRIRRDYLVNGRESRLRLLAGLMDSDGHQHGSGWEIVTKYEGLKDDICFLARSLGYRATWVEKKGTIKKLDFEGIYYRLHISGNCEEVPCLIPRKCSPPRRDRRDHLVTGFELIEKGVGKYCGFTIDGDGRFLLGDFTVTHNTTCCNEALASVQRAGGIAILMLSELKYDEKRAADQGIKVDGKKGSLIKYRPKTIEEVGDIIFEISGIIDRSKTTKPICILWDSLGATPCENELNEKRSDFSMDAAKAITGVLRKTQGLIRDKNIAFIMINQVYDKISGGFGKKTATKGGKSPRYYSALQLNFSRLGRIRPPGKKTSDPFCGIKIQIEAEKNHLGQPFKKIEMEIDWRGFVTDRKPEYAPEKSGLRLPE